MPILKVTCFPDFRPFFFHLTVSGKLVASLSQLSKQIQGTNNKRVKCLGCNVFIPIILIEIFNNKRLQVAFTRACKSTVVYG